MAIHLNLINLKLFGLFIRHINCKQIHIAIRFLWAHNNWDDGKLSIALNLDLVTIVGFLIATWINDYKLKQSSRNLIEIITNTSEKTRVVETVRVDDHFSEQAEESNLASDTKIRFVAV